jgi:transcriptional regulator
MYLPAHFNETRIDVLHALMRARPLTTLVTSSEAGLTANHIPVEILPLPSPLGLIRGHIARANPLWRQYREGTEALAIFQGPHSYISPSFYPSKAVSGEVVPTWNYAVVHAHGTLRFIQDTAWLRELVAGLTNTYEAQRPQPWQIGDAPAAYLEKMLSLIEGFELAVSSLTGKWKVGQNRTHADRQGVVENLQRANDADSHEIAAMLADRDA